MRCPHCGSVGATETTDSRLIKNGTERYRRRECEYCAARFTTRERTADALAKPPPSLRCVYCSRSIEYGTRCSTCEEAYKSGYLMGRGDAGLSTD